MAIFNTPDLVSFTQAGEGYSWLFDRAEAYKKYINFYNGDLTALYTIRPNMVNGLSVTDPRDGGSSFNMFRVASQFYQTSLLGELPAITSTNPERQEWLNEHTEEIMDALDEAVRWWTITGRVVLMLDGDKLRAINPALHQPVRALWDESEVVGHVVGYPFYAGQRAHSNVNHLPDQLRLVKWAVSDNPNTPADAPTGGGRVDTYILEAFNIGKRLNTQPANIRGMWMVDTKDGFYDELEAIVRDYNVRSSGLQMSLNMSVLPLLQTGESGPGILSYLSLIHI